MRAASLGFKIERSGDWDDGNSDVPASVFISRLGTPGWHQSSLLSDTRSQIKEGQYRVRDTMRDWFFPDRKQRAYHYLSLSGHFKCGRSATKNISHACYIQGSDKVKRLPDRAQAFVTEGPAWAVALVSRTLPRQRLGHWCHHSCLRAFIHRRSGRRRMKTDAIYQSRLFSEVGYRAPRCWMVAWASAISHLTHRGSKGLIASILYRLFDIQDSNWQRLRLGSL